MVRSPIHFIEIGNKTFDDMGLSDLVTGIEVDSAVDMMDVARIQLTYGHKLDQAYELLTHGQSVRISLGYASEAVYPVFHGFIQGVKVKASERAVEISLASYFEKMNKDEKKRSFEGLTVAQVIDAIASDYDNISVGTVDNGDYVLTDFYCQDSTDLETLIMLSKKTGMHLSLEPSTQNGSKGLVLSLRALGVETKPVEYNTIVYNPDEAQQNQLNFWHLKEFEPESNVLGTEVQVQVQSVNPRYNVQTEYEYIPEIALNFNLGLSIPYEVLNNELEPALGGLDVATNDLHDSDDIMLSSMDYYSYDDSGYYVGASAANQVYGGVLGGSDYQPKGLPAGSYNVGEPSGPEVGTYNIDIDVKYHQQATQNLVSSTSTFMGTDVVFTCFGTTTTVHFSENVTNEEAQRRIAEAIQNDSSYSFVVAKGCVLADGEASLKVGQKRNIQLNDFPLFGPAFSGDYVITGVNHIYRRSGQGFTTTFTCAKNSLEIPPEVVPAVGIGASGSDGCEEYYFAIWPGPYGYAAFNSNTGMLTSGGFVMECGEYYQYTGEEPISTPTSSLHPPAYAVNWEQDFGLDDFQNTSQEMFGWDAGVQSQIDYAVNNQLNPLTLQPAVYGDITYQPGDWIASENEWHLPQ